MSQQQQQQQQPLKRGRDSDDDDAANPKRAAQESEDDFRTETGRIGEVRDGCAVMIKLDNELGEMEIPQHILRKLETDLKPGQRVAVDFTERQEVPFQVKGLYMFDVASLAEIYVS